MQQNEIEKLIYDVLRRIGNLEQHIINFIMPMQDIKNLVEELSNPPKITIDDHAFKSNINIIFHNLNDALEKIERFSKIPQELLWICRHIEAMEKEIKEIKQEGIKKNIHLDISCDGYEMRKKINPYDKEIEEDKNIDPEDGVKALLDTLSSRESLVVCHRLGLLGEKKKTYEKIGEVIKVGKERVSQIYKKSLRKLRHPKRKNLVENITHIVLRKEITGN